MAVAASQHLRAAVAPWPLAPPGHRLCPGGAVAGGGGDHHPPADRVLLDVLVPRHGGTPDCGAGDIELGGRPWSVRRPGGAGAGRDRRITHRTPQSRGSARDRAVPDRWNQYLFGRQRCSAVQTTIRGAGARARRPAPGAGTHGRIPGHRQPRTAHAGDRHRRLHPDRGPPVRAAGGRGAGRGAGPRAPGRGRLDVRARGEPERGAAVPAGQRAVRHRARARARWSSTVHCATWRRWRADR